MFPLPPRTTRPTTLNAFTPTHPDDQPARRARHLAQCEELAALGMDMARAAHREAMKDLQAPLKHRMPGMALPPTCRHPEPGHLFTRLSRCVRQAILLETRIAAGFYDRPKSQPAATRENPSSPRPNRPDDRPNLAHERIEDDLADDAHRTIPDILAAVALELNAVVDRSQPPDRPHPIFPDTKRQGVLATQPHRLAPPKIPPKPAPPTAAERAARLAETPARPRVIAPPPTG